MGWHQLGELDPNMVVVTAAVAAMVADNSAELAEVGRLV